MGRRVLILGGTRFFGKQLAKALVENGDSVTLATRMRHADDFGNRIERIRVDRGEREALSRTLRGTSWDLVYDQTCFHPHEAEDAVRTFSGKIGHLIFTSSAAVYGWAAAAHPEGDFPARHFQVLWTKSSDYATGKRGAEAIYLHQAPFPVTAVRFPPVLGPDDFSGRLEFHFTRTRAGLPIGIRNQNAKSCFIERDEAARFLFWAGHEPFSGPLNACSHGGVTVQTLCEMIGTALKRPVSVHYSADAEGMSPFSWPESLLLDTSLASRLGFTFNKLEEWLPQRLAACATVSMATETTPRA